MQTTQVSRFHIIIFLTIISFLSNNKNAFANTVPESSGKIMSVKTPDNVKSPDYLVIEKQNGKKSLIKIEKQERRTDLLERKDGT